MQGLTVKYKNELNTVPMRNFSAKEMDLFFSICAKMKNKNTDMVIFGFDELKELSQYKSTSITRFADDLENIFDKMQKLTYRQQIKGVRSKFVLFPFFEIDENEKTVEISANKKLEYILNEITNEFTQFELKEFTGLRSSYSKTMYRLLKQFKSTGYYTVKIDEFRELLDIPVSYRIREIDTRVLKPIKKELSQFFKPFIITKVKAKKGNKIDRLEFRFQEKQHEDELPIIPIFDWMNE